MWFLRGAQYSSNLFSTTFNFAASSGFANVNPSNTSNPLSPTHSFRWLTCSFSSFLCNGPSRMRCACRLKRRHSWCKSWAVHDISGGLNFAIVAVFTISGNSVFYFQSAVSLIACFSAWKRISSWHHVLTLIKRWLTTPSHCSMCSVTWDTLWLTRGGK